MFKQIDALSMLTLVDVTKIMKTNYIQK